MSKIIFLLIILWCYNLCSQIIESDTLIYSKEDFLENISDDESIMDEIFEEPPIRIGENLLSKPNIELRSRFKKQLARSRGYEEKVYLGSPLYSYQRIKIGNKVAEGGLLFKKDAGEKSYSDFTNYFLQLNNFLFIRKIVLGDYVMEVGQGLMFWRGYAFAKGYGFNETTIRRGRELQSYNSADELGFLRGFATELNLRYFQLLGFYSNRNLTATIDTSGVINNFYLIYFRTASDLLKRNNTNEKICGFRIYRQADNLKLGVTFSKYVYSKAVERLRKSSFSNLGMDIMHNNETVKIATEFYLNELHHFNSVFVLKLIPVKDLSVILLYRNYSLNTFNRFSNPFGEYSGGNNENGAFIGLYWRINKYLLLSCYTDKNSIPFAATYKYSKQGCEYFIQLNNSMFKNFVFYLRYQSKVFEDKHTSLTQLNRLIKINELFTKENFRFNLNFHIAKGVRYRFRTEYLILRSRYIKIKDYGRLFYHDIYLDITTHTALNFRVTLFSTGSYQSGISSYENDLDGVLTNPILYGKGLKWYFLIKYRLKKLILISLKYSYLLREDVRRIGTGWDQLPTNIDNRIGIQLDLNL